MKLKQTSPGQIEYNESGISTIIIALVLIVAGIGAAVLPLLRSAVEWWASLVGVVLIALGIYLFLSAKKVRTILRNPGVSEITETTIVTKKSSTQSFDASQVASVVLDSSTSYVRETANSSNSYGEMRRERTSVLYVLLKDNNQVVIATEKNNGTGGITVGGINLSSFGKAPLADEAQQLAAFYGVELSSHESKPLGIEDIGRVVGQIKQGLSGASYETPNQATAQPIITPQEQPLPSSNQATSPLVQSSQPVTQPPVIASAPIGTPVVQSSSSQQPPQASPSSNQ